MTEQEKREKVIKALECCTKKVCIYKDTEKKCPYWELCGEYESSFEDCTTALSKDSLALLKAQEPRVMTLEEVLALPYDTPLYIENCDGLYGWDIFSGTTKDDDNEVVTGASWATAEYWSQDEYGDTWRCWTSRPDEKRSAETPWDC